MYDKPAKGGINLIDQVFAMAPQPGTQGGAGGAFMGLLPFILIVFIMYFLIIRPQQKKQREHQGMLTALRKGDKVLTAGGLYGTIVGIKEKEDVIVVKIAENVKAEMSKQSVTKVIEKGSGE